MEKNRISVIIPLYNAVEYLPRCLASLDRQTYQNFEIVFVDDGSKDNALEFCSKLCLKDPDRYAYCGQANGGPGAARNRGIANCRGEWLTFIDADDYVDDDYLECLLNACLENDCLISACDCAFEDENCKKYTESWNIKKPKIASKDEVFSDLVGMYLYAAVVTMKLIHKSCFEGTEFPCIKYGEDSAYITILAEKAGKIVYFPKEGYHYVRVKTSATMKGVPDYVVKLDHLIVWYNLYVRREFLSEKDTKALMDRYQLTIYEVITSLLKEKAYNIYKERTDYILEHVKNVLPIASVNKKYRNVIKGFMKNPEKYYFRNPERRMNTEENN